MADAWIGLIGGLVHLVLGLVLGVVTIYGSFRIFHRLILRDGHVESLRQGNLAVASVLSGVLVATAVIVRACMGPAVSAMQSLLFGPISTLDVVRLAGMILGYVALAVVLANVCIWIAMTAFMRLTKDLDEMAEVSRGNVAVGLVLGFTIAMMGVFLSQGLASLLQALVPFPAFVPIEILGG